MAAYADLASLMNLIHDIKNDHSPPVSVDIEQLLSLSQILTFLIQTFESSVADGHEYDPLELGIADAACAAEDVIDVQQIESISFCEDLQRVIEEMDLLMNIDTEKAIAVHVPLKSLSSTSTAMVCLKWKSSP